MDGKYFTDESYTVAFTAYDDYLVTVDASDSLIADKPTVPDVVTLDENGA